MNAAAATNYGIKSGNARRLANRVRRGVVHEKMTYVKEAAFLSKPADASPGTTNKNVYQVQDVGRDIVATWNLMPDKNGYGAADGFQSYRRIHLALPPADYAMAVATTTIQLGYDSHESYSHANLKGWANGSKANAVNSAASFTSIGAVQIGGGDNGGIPAALYELYLQYAVAKLCVVIGEAQLGSQIPDVKERNSKMKQSQVQWWTSELATLSADLSEQFKLFCTAEKPSGQCKGAATDEMASNQRFMRSFIKSAADISATTGTSSNAGSIEMCDGRDDGKWCISGSDSGARLELDVRNIAGPFMPVVCLIFAYYATYLLTLGPVSRSSGAPNLWDQYQTRLNKLAKSVACAMS